MKQRTALVSFGLALAAGTAWCLWPPSPTTPDWAGDYDVTARPPELISPGTVVGTSPPEGWTHLVIKSEPRVRPGDEPKIPRIARSQTIQMSRWMFTAFVADVRPETHAHDAHYHLRAVALGLGASVNGRDVVITPETAERHGVKLDWITRTILTKGYQTQDLAMVVVHAPSFALLDTPVWFHCGEKNRLIRFRYALLIDTVTGRLDVLVWVLDPEGNCGDPTLAVLLPPNVINPAELIPDPDGFDRIGIASDSAFGVDCLPPHRVRMTLPPGLRALTAGTKFTPEEARTLEAGLRQLLATAR